MRPEGPKRGGGKESKGERKREVEGKQKVAVYVCLSLSCTIQTYTKGDGNKNTIT